MIYLSKLLLNARSHQVSSEIESPYEMHRTLANAFGATDDAQKDARCLFRVEDNRDSSEVVVLVQSLTEPDWDRLKAKASGNYLRSSIVKKLELQFAAGQRLAFRLRANPTKANDGKRTGLYDDESRGRWFARKAGEAGFLPLTVSITDESKTLSRPKDSSRQAAFSAARFDGLLNVTEPDLLLKAVQGGIGAGKGFGFGLLSLIKA